MSKENLHNKFRKVDEELPEYLSWEKMEAGILSKKEALDKKDDPNNKFYILLIFLLFISGTTLLYFISNNSTKETTTALAKVKQNSAPSSIAEISKTKKTNSINTIIKEINAAKNEVSNSKNKINLNKNYYNKISGNPKKSSEIKQNFILPTKEKKELLREVNVPARTRKYTQKESVAATTNPSFSILNRLKVPAIKPLNYASNWAGFPSHKNDPEDNEDPKKSGKGFEISLTGGMTSWATRYSGSKLAAENSLAENEILSYGLAADLSWYFREKWKITSGIEYLSLESKLDYTYKKDSVLTRSHSVTSALTGNPLSVPNWSSNREAVATLRTKHFNKHQLISIPVLLTAQFKMPARRFGVELGAGIKYTFLSTSKGKTLRPLPKNSSGEFAPFPIGQSDFSFANKFYLLGNTSVFYQLNKNISIKFSSRISYALKDIHLSPEVKSNPILLYNNIGMDYRF